MKVCKIFLMAVFCFISATVQAVDTVQVEKDLHSTGALGWIHGAVHERHLYVFTVRNPKNFFDYVEMSLIAATPDVERVLLTLTRHDKVLVRGEFLENPSPQKHISATSVVMVEKFQSGVPADPYEHEAKIPDELLSVNTAIFLVHAIASDGHILVVEYKDQVLPIFVKDNALTKNLYRNDVVQMNFELQKYPGSPTHLKLDETSPTPLTVIESIKALHGQPAKVEGALVMFPKSPEVRFNVFAVQQLLANGLKRQFTLVNFDSNDEFVKIRETLQAAWDRHPGCFKNARNKLVSTQIRVRAVGTFNEVDANQANAQILLPSVNALTIQE